MSTFPGWTVESSSEWDFYDGEPPETQQFPPEGEIITVTEEITTREVGEDDEEIVTAGARGEVLGYVVDWFDVHVRLTDGREVWISPDNMTPATREDNA